MRTVRIYDKQKTSNLSLVETRRLLSHLSHSEDNHLLTVRQLHTL